MEEERSEIEPKKKAAEQTELWAGQLSAEPVQECNFPAFKVPETTDVIVALAFQSSD